MPDTFEIAGQSFTSRLFLGTGGYPNQQVMLDAHAASGGLSYQSQNEPRHFGALRKALKIYGRLGGSASMTQPFPSRPRYMHRRTYQRLKRQYEAAMEQYVGGSVRLPGSA